MKPKRRIEDLAIGEYIYCETKKQAKKLFTPLGFDTVHAEKCWIGRNMVGFFWQTEEINSGTECHASDFLSKKSKKASKKWVRKEIAKTLKVTDAENVVGELEQPKEIDWSVPGQLVSCNNSTLIVMTSGNHKSTSFEGTVLFDSDNFQQYKVGVNSNDWSKSKFKPYTGEPIILNP